MLGECVGFYKGLGGGFGVLRHLIDYERSWPERVRAEKRYCGTCVL